MSVSCDCEMSLILREEHKLHVFENEVLKKVFEHEKYDISKQFRILREGLHDLYRPQCVSAHSILMEENSIRTNMKSYFLLMCCYFGNKHSILLDASCVPYLFQLKQ